jgi:hypothetical protein
MVIGYKVYYWIELKDKKNGCLERGGITCFEQALIAIIT